MVKEIKDLEIISDETSISLRDKLGTFIIGSCVGLVEAYENKFDSNQVGFYLEALPFVIVYSCFVMAVESYHGCNDRLDTGPKLGSLAYLGDLVSKSMMELL